MASPSSTADTVRPQAPAANGWRPSDNVVRMKESATIAVSARARELRAAGRAVIDLGAGEPDFPTPDFVARAAKAAVDAGYTKYTLTDGILPLRQAIAARANEVYAGADVGPSEVVVSNGTKQALFNACFVLFGPGDEVLVPTPGWTSYYEILGLARATAVPVRGDPARGLKVDRARLAAAATERTRGLILNSPCNPTGSVYSPTELRDLLDLAAERGWWVISDEIYARIAYEDPAPSAFAVARERDRLIVVDGVAKAYAMTGWRIGWAVAPRAVAAAMCALQSHVTSNAAAPSQHAALAALTERAAAESSIAAMVAAFRHRRDAALAELAAEPRLPLIHPAGAFYVYADVSALGDRAGDRFARHMLDAHEVAVVPGSAFLTPGWVRMSYAAPVENVVAGARRMVAAYRELSSQG